MGVKYQELLGQVFKHTNDGDLKADLYLPATIGSQVKLRPAVIVVHGGGWYKKSGNMRWICREIAKAGFAAINIEYRLAPKYKYPAAVEDVIDAVHWVKANSQKYSLDPERLAGWGYSAGANLILLAGLEPKMGFKALVGGGTPANLSVWPRSPLVLRFLGKKRDEDPELWKRASPVHAVQKGSPSVFLYHGRWDIIVAISQLNMMVEALKAKEVDVDTYISPYLGHLPMYINKIGVTKAIKFIKQKLISN